MEYTKTTWIVILTIYVSSFLLYDTLTVVQLSMFPVLAAFVLLTHISHARSNSISSTVFLVGLNLYSTPYLVYRQLQSSKGSYITEISCSVLENNLRTTASYLGLTVYFTSDLDTLTDEYIDATTEDMTIEITSSTEMDLFTEGNIDNCSTCPNSDNFSKQIAVKLQRYPHITWDITLCNKCFKKITTVQLETLQQESELLESKLVLEEL